MPYVVKSMIKEVESMEKYFQFTASKNDESRVVNKD